MSPFRRFIRHPSALLLLLCLPFLVRGDGPAAPPDPVPLRRVWLTPDGVARAMEQARQGLLVRLPRDEFEKLVAQAARAEAARKNPPRLVAASYHARLADGGLAGTLQWKVIHTAAGPGLLPLAPLNLALRQPRLAPLNPEPGRPPGSPDAYIGDFDGHDPSLLIESPGEYEASDDWSARSEPGPKGLQFDLRFPACPAAVLELDLPPDMTPVVDGGALGPDDADAPDLRRWTIPCGGRSQVALLLRPADQAPVLRAGLETTQILSAEGLDATYAFSVQSLHQGVRELTFECDPSLRPYDVDAPNLDRWDVAPPGPKAPASRVTVRLSAPLDEGTVRIRCVGPLGGPARGPGPVAWSSPGVRLLQSVNGGETLTLKVHPDLRLADVEAGAFRLQESASEKGADGRADWQRLTFVGGGLAAPGGRPRATLRPHAVEFRARQLAWWRVDHAALTLQIAYDVTCGRLFQLAVRLPADWEVDGVSLAPDGPPRNWAVRTENGARVLVVDLQKAASPPEKPGARGPRLTVQLRPTRPGDVLGKEQPFPDAEPLGARFREGALAVGFDEQTHVLEVRTAAAQAPPDDDGPWQEDLPAHSYPYREPPGAGRPAPAGSVRLLPRPPRIRAQCTSDVVLSAGQVSVDTRLLLEAEQGSPDALRSVDLYLSAPAAPTASGDPWNWRVERGGVEVQGASRLPGVEAAAALAALGAADPLGEAALRIARPRGECWRVTFNRPLTVRRPVVLHALLAPKAGDGPLAVPLTALLGASRMEGEATLHLAAASPPQVEALGLREAVFAADARPRGGAAWRTFRYSGAAVGLALAGPLQGGDRPPEASVDWAALTTYVRGDGAPEHHYSFQASHWSQNTLPLQMPAGARVLAFQVDGVWSPLAPATEDGPGGPVIDLPAPARGGDQDAAAPRRYEVVYTTAAGPSGPWARVEAPAPSPPVPPAAFRRLWRLAPDLCPVGDGRLRRRPGPGEGTPSAAAPLRPEDLFRAAPEPPFSWPAAWDEARRPEALRDVLLGLRGKEPKQRPLGLVLGDAAGALRRKHGQFLVVDAAALRDAGVDPTRPVTLPAELSEDEAPPWDELGATAAPIRGGCLLTTRRQLAAWGESAGEAAAPAAVEAAAGEAARWGRDASGRFQAAAVWAGAPLDSKSPLPSPEMDLAQWTEWEPAPGGGDVAAVVVVRRPLFDAAGWALAVPLGLALQWLGRRWKRARLALLLAWLAAAGVGLLWLPAALRGLAWPALLLGCAAAVLWRVWSAVRGPAKVVGKSPSGLAAAGSAAALLLVAVCGRSRPSDAPAPAATTVYLVAGDADRVFVLAPPELLDQLRTLARPGAGPAAVPVAAEYAGEVVGGAAEIDAKFQVLCFTDEAATVALPLDGVQLCRSPKNPDAGEVEVGGTPVRATALPAPQAGVAVPIHAGPAAADAPRVEWISLHFRAPVAATDEGRDLQFMCPRLPQSRLVLHLPKGSAYVQAPTRRGVRNPSAGDPYTLDVEQGGVAAPLPLHVRWTAESGPALWPEVQVKEAYLWDLGADASRLTALLSYAISPGGVDSLAVRIPEGLEVLSVEARRPRDGTLVRARDWRVSGAGAARTLSLDFPSPVSGDIDVTLELVPRSPWPNAFVLPLPSPLLPPGPAGLPAVGAGAVGLLASPLGQGPGLAASALILGGSGPAGGRLGRPKASYLAYRTRGLAVERVNPVGVTGIPYPFEEFAPFWPAATRPDPHSLAYAAVLSREDGGRPPVLGLTVRPAAPADAARVDLEARVGPAQADVRASAVLTAREGGLSLVEWRVRSAQPFTATGVAGPNVKRWTQEGGRVLAWLEPPARGEVKLELTGWLPLAPNGPRLELPNLRIASAASQETTVRLVPAGGVALAEAGRSNLTPLPLGDKGKESGGILTYTAGGRDDYGAAWQVRAGPPRVRVYTVAGAPNRRLSFTSVVDVDPSFGDVEALEVRVRNWPGTVEIAGPQGMRQRPLRRGPDEWAWALEQDAGKAGRLRLVLTGEQLGTATPDPATGPGAGAVMPEVSVPGAAPVEQWAAVAGADLTAEAALGLARVEGAPAELASDPAAAKMGKADLVWKATAPQWRLNLAPRDASSSAAPIEVYLAEYRAAPADVGRWTHEAVYWLRHDANTDLNLTLPADAEVLSAAIDGEETAPLQAEARRLWLPLTGRPAVCRVRVRWRYTAEDWARPNLDRPILEGAPDGPGLWTVLAPTGWKAGTPGRSEDDADLHHGLTAAAALSWQRAEALLRVSAVLARQAAEGGGAGALDEAQRRFYAECRRAREELEASPERAAPGWPDGRKPSDRLQDLLERNRKLAAEQRFEAVRTGAEAAVDADGAGRADGSPAWAAEGRPLYAWAVAGAPAPKVVLTPDDDHRPPAWAASAAWLAVLLLVGLVSMSPSAGAWSRALWPEQIALVGLAGWWAAGALTPVVAALLLLAAVGRMMTALVAIGRLFRRPPPRSKSTASMPALPESSGS